MEGFICTIDGSPITACKLLDVSKGGAKLRVLTAKTIPDEFVLLLSKNGKVRRRCHVRWCKDDVFGVRFMEESA